MVLVVEEEPEELELVGVEEVVEEEELVETEARSDCFGMS